MIKICENIYEDCEPITIINIIIKSFVPNGFCDPYECESIDKQSDRNENSREIRHVWSAKGKTILLECLTSIRNRGR